MGCENQKGEILYLQYWRNFLLVLPAQCLCRTKAGFPVKLLLNKLLAVSSQGKEDIVNSLSTLDKRFSENMSMFVVSYCNAKV